MKKKPKKISDEAYDMIYDLWIKFKEELPFELNALLFWTMINNVSIDRKRAVISLLLLDVDKDGKMWDRLMKED